jgi:para-aminobenzoate synthetase component I
MKVLHPKPPIVREIVYAEPFVMARRLKGERDLVLLESVQRHEHLGRYSFLAVNPSASFNDLGEADAHLRGNPRAHVDGLPPFQGGMLGYISYDYGRVLEPKARISVGELPMPALVLKAYDTVVSVDHLQERAWIIAGHEAQADEMEKLLLRKPADVGSHRAGPFTPLVTRAQHEHAVQRTIDYILDGDIFQANITQVLSADVPEGFDPYGLYKVLRERNAATFASLIDFDEVKLVSNSPERLVRFDGVTAEARPIKGTRKRDADPVRDAELVTELLASRKDRAENVMIVDLLRNDLSRVSKPGTVRVPVLCGLESYANVHHLVSAVTGDLRDGLGQVDLLRAVFPGGSITGAPKIRAMEIIAELEGHPRGIYCGSIGYMGYSGHCDFNIAIRTVQQIGGKLLVQGGGGITARSEPSAEYDESLLKVARIMEAFAT